VADGFPAAPNSRPDIFSGEQQRLLADNLDPKNVKTLRGNGYIEGWHAINEANRIFGFGAWDVELRNLEKTNADLVDVTKDRSTKKQWRVGYIATVRVTVYGEGGSRFRDGTGFGSGYGQDNQLGEAIESASKEAETDAFKRACRNFGNQFGLALYDKKRANVGPSKLDEDMNKDQDPDAGEREELGPEAAGVDAPPPSAPVATLPKAKARAEFTALQEGIRNCTTSHMLKLWARENADGISRQPDDWKDELRTQYGEMLHGLEGLEYAARVSAEADAAIGAA
jgi:DNA repair and recombination protein RAD52